MILLILLTLLTLLIWRSLCCICWTLFWFKFFKFFKLYLVHLFQIHHYLVDLEEIELYNLDLFLFKLFIYIPCSSFPDSLSWSKKITFILSLITIRSCFSRIWCSFLENNNLKKILGWLLLSKLLNYKITLILGFSSSLFWFWSVSSNNCQFKV